jgi:hypothetical protein
MSTRKDDNTVLIVMGGLVGIVVIVCVTAVAIAVKDGARAATMIGLIVPILTVLLGFFGLFRVVQSIKSDVREVKQDTYDLTNGLGAAKSVEAIATVLPDHMIDPAALPIIHAARERLARRAAAVDSAEALLQPHADLDVPDDQTGDTA